MEMANTALERIDERYWCYIQCHLRPLNFAVRLQHGEQYFMPKLDIPYDRICKAVMEVETRWY